MHQHTQPYELQQVPLYTVLLGSQMVFPFAGPHVPSVEYFGACLFSGTRRWKDLGYSSSLLTLAMHLQCLSLRVCAE